MLLLPRCMAKSRKQMLQKTLFNVSIEAENSLKTNKGAIFTWKLVYKDQYGRGDTLNIKTKNDSYESHDKSITKCYNAISNEKGYGNYCKFDEEISPEEKKYKNPRCMIHKKNRDMFLR